jgi:hypothetical protein
MAPIRHLIEVINLHMLWDPHIRQGSFVISTLEHVGEHGGTNSLTFSYTLGFCDWGL